MLDAVKFNRNQNESFPPEKQRPFFGQVIAWSNDGTKMLGYAPTFEQLYELMDRLGLKTTEFVVDGFLADYEPDPRFPPPPIEFGSGHSA